MDIMRLIKRWVVCLTLLLSCFCWSGASLALVRGIYITQTTLESTDRLKSLIQNAKAVGIDTFVIDYERGSKLTTRNIELVKQAHLHYVARIIMFPDGALPEQVRSQEYLAKRYRQIDAAVALGAEEIQLDYIRYRQSHRPSTQNARDIYGVVQAVRERLKGKGVRLQMDVFGISSFRESLYIGQNPQLFAHSVDAICPMVYPSHFEPFRYRAVRPYETVHQSLSAMRENLSAFPNVQIYAYIELSNYRYPLTHEQRVRYILSEMKAVKDANIAGYYIWSAQNRYDILFEVLRSLRASGKTDGTVTKL